MADQRQPSQNIIDAIKSSISGTAQRVGEAAKLINLTKPVKGTWKLPFINISFPDIGVTEATRYLFGKPVSAEVQSLTNNPKVLEQRTVQQNLPKELKKQQLENQVEKSQQGAVNKLVETVSGNNQNMSVVREFTADDLRALGVDPDSAWDQAVITIAGQKFRVEDTGRGTRKLYPIKETATTDNKVSRDQLINAARQSDPLGLLDKTGKHNDIIENYYKRGMDLASSIEKALKEAADQEYGSKLDVLRSQKSEAERIAGEQKRQGLETRNFLVQKAEQQRQREIEDIGVQREMATKNINVQKEELGANFRDLIRKFQAQTRAMGASVSGFTEAETRRLASDFNRNIAAISSKHQDILNEFNRAIRNTNQLFDQKTSELDFNLQKENEKIDSWLQSTINSIQNQERMSIADKYERIAEAIVQAEQLRMNIEKDTTYMKQQWAMFLMQAQQSMNVAAFQASKNEINNAYKTLSQITDFNNKLLHGLKSGSLSVVREGDKYYAKGTDQISGGNIFFNLTPEQVKNYLEDTTEQQQKSQLEKIKALSQLAQSGLVQDNDIKNYIKQSLGL